jgi:hypothetical protein
MPLETRHNDLIRQGDRLFSDRAPLMSWWQECAENFYPERAYFTTSPILGRDFTAHLTNSYPVMVRRDLGNAFSAMLRPKGKQWFAIRSEFTDDDWASRRWLEYAAGVQRRAMYDRDSQFVRATKEGDHDYALIGQCVLTLEMNRAKNGLLYRNWHTKDVVWWENAEGKICGVQRNWEPTLLQLKGHFGEKAIPANLKAEFSTNPFRTVKVRHVVIEAAEYAEVPGAKKWDKPYVSVYIDIENGNVLEERAIPNKHYIIPRWQTVSGSQYAYSPAVIAALPDARLIQAMTLTLLQAGEKADPPMTAQQGVIRSDLDLRSGGVTWVDKEYDERLGKALEPIAFDRSGIQYGLKMQEETRAQIAEAFYLNKLGLPPAEREMTAYETGQRVQEYIRQALPLFEPMEDDYNGQLCDETFSMLMRNDAFGPRDSIPPALRGANVQFHFESPLIKAEGTEKGAIFNNAAQLLAAAAQVDPASADVIDAPSALRDALYGIGVPTKWTKSPDAVAQIVQQRQKKQAIAEAIQAAHGAGAAAEQIGTGAQALQQAQAAAAVGQVGRAA